VRNRAERNAVGNHALVSRQHRLTAIWFSMRKVEATTCAKPCIPFQTNRPAKVSMIRNAQGCRKRTAPSTRHCALRSESRRRPLLR
jgi:hypothetical protein